MKILRSLFAAFLIGSLLMAGAGAAQAVDWRHVGVPGDTYGKRIDLQGDTPALLFSDGQDTYAFWQKSTGELLLELFQDTDVLEVDTRGRVTIFKNPTADSDAATKKYVDNNVGGGGDGGMSAWGDGSDTVTDPDTGVAGDNIDLVPSATPGKFRLNASGGGSSDTAGLRFSDGGTFQGIYPEANFGTDLSVSCDGDTCTVNSTASGGGGSGWPGQGEILASDGNIYTDLGTARQNADTYLIFGPGTFSDTVEITTDGFYMTGSGDSTILESSANGFVVKLSADDVLVQDMQIQCVQGSACDRAIYTAVGTEDNIMRNILIQHRNNSQGIDLDGKRHKILDSEFNSSISGGHIIRERNDADSITISRNTFDVPQNPNVINGSFEGIRVTANEALGNNNSFKWFINSASNSYIANNTYYGASKFIQTTGRSDVIGNRCVNCTSSGYVLNGGSSDIFIANRYTGTGDDVVFNNSPSGYKFMLNDFSGEPGTNNQLRSQLDMSDSPVINMSVSGLSERSDTPTVSAGEAMRWLCEDSAGSLSCDTGDVVESINNGTSTKHIIDIDFSAN